MILRDPDLIERMRHWPRCEWCGAKNVHGLDPAHIFSRGAGQVDIPGNLVALCRECHSWSHDGNPPTTSDLLAIAAAREGCLQDEIRAEVYRIRREPKP